MQTHTKYSNECTPFVARNQEGKVLIHTVSIPDLESGVKFCTISEKIKNSTPNQDDIYYHLVAADKWRDSANKISCDHDLSTVRAENKESFPHQTFFHAWMTPEDAETYLSTALHASDALKIAPYTSLPTSQILLPHWIGGTTNPDQLDDVFWCAIPREGLLDLQMKLAMIAKNSAPSCEIITQLGEGWKTPHTTLIGRAHHNNTSEDNEKINFTVTPTLAIGVSGWNGQFRGIAGIFNGPNGSTPAEKAIQNLRLHIKS